MSVTKESLQSYYGSNCPVEKKYLNENKMPDTTYSVLFEGTHESKTESYVAIDLSDLIAQFENKHGEGSWMIVIDWIKN